MFQSANTTKSAKPLNYLSPLILFFKALNPLNRYRYQFLYSLEKYFFTSSCCYARYFFTLTVNPQYIPFFMILQVLLPKQTVLLSPYYIPFFMLGTLTKTKYLTLTLIHSILHDRYSYLNRLFYFDPQYIPFLMLSTLT